MSLATRRHILLGAAAATLPGTARAEAPLNVFAHKVHQAVATTGPGGDITAAFTAQTGIAVKWTTFDIAPLADRLLREASLTSSDVDVGFLVNTQIVPRVARLFEPLEPYMASAPIEAPEDLFPGLVKGLRIEPPGSPGSQLGLPFRHASSGLHYNAAILAERGISKPPGTIEELAEMIRRCTFRRDDGSRVAGLVLPGMAYPNVIDLARAWDGDFVNAAYRCVADEPGMLNAIRLLRALFQEGALPRNFTTLLTEDITSWMQAGRAAFTLQSMSRNRLFNDPKAGAFAGQFKTVAVPISETLHDRYAVAPAKVEFWGMVIPRNSSRKDMAWRFMRSLLTKDATLRAALNGNGPARRSTYDDPAFATTIPYAVEERRVLEVARVPLPPFDEAARAADFFREEAEAAVLGMKTPDSAMQSLVKRVTPLLPA